MSINILTFSPSGHLHGAPRPIACGETEAERRAAIEGYLNSRERRSRVMGVGGVFPAHVGRILIVEAANTGVLDQGAPGVWTVKAYRLGGLIFDADGVKLRDAVDVYTTATAIECVDHVIALNALKCGGRDSLLPFLPH